MTDEAALLAAVLARPLNNTPRLVYADWLDEHDDGGGECAACGGKCREYRTVNPGCDTEHDYDAGPCPTCSGRGWVPSGAAARAEFIRVQVELARGPGGIPKAIDIDDPEERQRWTDRVCWLGRREQSLLEQHWLEWASLPEIGWACLNFASPAFLGRFAAGVNACGFSRGFVDELRVPTLATLFGGPCGRCGGGGILTVTDTTDPPWVEDDPCPECKGDREYRTPGIAAAVFAAHPVVSTIVNDLSPETGWSSYGSLRLDKDDPFVWGRTAGNTAGDGLVSDDVWEAMCGWVQADGWWKSYSTRRDALTALSTAITTIGRRRAGLEPLS